MEKPAIIIDQAFNMRSGFSGEEEPRSVLTCLVGRPKMTWGCGMECVDYFIGSEAEEKSGILIIKSPLEDDGHIDDFDDIEKIWETIYSKELTINPEEHSVLIAVPGDTKEIDREKIACIMMESFNIPNLYIANKHELIMVKEAKSDGIIFDSGEKVTSIVPIKEWKEIKGQGEVYKFGGRNVNEYLIKLLNHVNVCLTTREEKKIAEEIKKQMCYVALDYEAEINKKQDNEYVLPNGDKIKLKNTIYKTGEILFNPSLIGKEEEGFAKKCIDVIQKFDSIEDKKKLYSNIVLSGGNTLLKGFDKRFEKEIKGLVPAEMKENVNVIAKENRENSAWIGGSIYSSLPLMKDLWLTKDEYMEYGSEYANTKYQKK